MTANNLTREQRVDKNGKLNTKLIRSVPKPLAPRIAMPAPSVAEAITPAADTTQKRWRTGTESWECDNELRHICSVVLTAQQTYSCSDAEAYDILTVIDPENLHPLLAVGIRSKQSALDFMAETGLKRLERDNQTLVDEAIARDLRLRPFCEFWVENTHPAQGAAFMDAAEAHCLMSRHMWGKDAVSRVLNRLVDLDDIKTIGVQRFVKMANDGSSHGTGNLAIDQLQKIKDGTSEYDITTMKRFLVHAGKQHDTSGEVIPLANRYGVETVLAIDDLYSARSLSYNLTSRGYTKEKGAAALIFADKIRHVRQPEFNPPEILTLFEAYDGAGFNLEQSLYGISKKLTPEQLRAVYNGNVIPAVAEGWL